VDVTLIPDFVLGVVVACALRVYGACVRVRMRVRMREMPSLRRSLGLDAAAGVSGIPPYMRGSFGAPVSVRSARDRRWRSAALRAEMPPRIPGVPLNAPPRLAPRSLGFVALTRSACQRRMVTQREGRNPLRPKSVANRSH